MVLCFACFCVPLGAVGCLWVPLGLVAPCIFANVSRECVFDSSSTERLIHLRPRVVSSIPIMSAPELIDTLGSVTHNADGTLRQNRTATYIVHFLSAVVLGVGVLIFQPSAWTTVLVGLLIAYHLNIGRVLLISEHQHKFKYLPNGHVYANGLTLVLLGALQAVRLRMTNLLFSHLTVGLWFLDAAEVLAIAAWAFYLLVRGRSARFRIQFLGRLQVLSMTALGLAFLYKHLTRRHVFVHIRHDWRLLYLGLAQLSQAGLLALHSHLPAWILEAAALLSHALTIVCVGHERLRAWDGN
ncbi:uncharacterized protein MONBRDRAFT_10449 [Monosiga brevicollis MX1]|uniref:Uncharacterized protein n=1 Tax=Monosiga brevicollis TaxID=81824 RepID=A9V687_MONBE|nr:uncharacterized protein MONBRDRAFT_10449 [Monosiga brevicollis MX1]EDQ86946.1 predicted protein [Monosiga brevicollis MX1]|eukprot:XP_001748185.1 hypothetical protein [Monosiga brevicollis MX1]